MPLIQLKYPLGYYTARSGKPAAFLVDGPAEFGSETEIRRIMSKESKGEAHRRNGGGDDSNKIYVVKEEIKRGLKDITKKPSKMRG